MSLASILHCSTRCCKLVNASGRCRVPAGRPGNWRRGAGGPAALRGKGLQGQRDGADRLGASQGCSYRVVTVACSGVLASGEPDDVAKTSKVKEKKDGQPEKRLAAPLCFTASCAAILRASETAACTFPGISYQL